MPSIGNETTFMSVPWSPMPSIGCGTSSKSVPWSPMPSIGHKTSLKSVPWSPQPSQGSISQYLSVSGSGTAVLASARRALDESSNCLFLLPRSLSEGDQENNMLHCSEVILLCCTVYISSSSYLMGLKFILTVNTNGDIG